MTLVVGRSDIERFRLTVARQLGLRFDDAKTALLGDVLRQRMAATVCSQVDAYLERLDSSSERASELRALAEELTVGETFFFRNADHFRALARAVVPERLRARSTTRRLRVLSAGCASGEEPYSLAILLRELVPDLRSWDVRIVGIDVNRAMLERAASARYSTWSLRATPEETRSRYFRPSGRELELDSAIREMVTLGERNLAVADPTFWQPETFDIVLCRNVIMYFTSQTMLDVVEGISRALVPGGFLFLGHAETLRGLSEGFDLCSTHDTFYYRRREAKTDWASAARPPDEPRTEVATSWIDAIQRASDRIASLAETRRRSVEDTPSGEPTTTRSWSLALVLEAMRQERFAEALELLDALPPESRHDPDVVLVRAALLTNSGRLAEAEETCTSLLALDERSAGAHYLMALCREHADDPSGAFEHDRAAVYVDTEFAMPHLHMGLMARRAGNDALARRELAHALVLLSREDVSRLVLFGGGFSRDALLALCRLELRAIGGDD